VEETSGGNDAGAWKGVISQHGDANAYDNGKVSATSML